MEVPVTTTPLGPPTMGLKEATTLPRTGVMALAPGATGLESASMPVEVGAAGVGAPAKPVGGRAMGAAGEARKPRTWTSQFARSAAGVVGREVVLMAWAGVS